MSALTFFLVVVLLAVWVVAILEAVAIPGAAYRRGGTTKAPWVALAVVGGPVGWAVWRVAGRKVRDQLFSVAEEAIVAPGDDVVDDTAGRDGSWTEGVEALPGVAKPDPILVVDRISRHFGGLLAVDVDHLEVQRGSITALIGPNGAGKTTLFNLLTGFDRADSGRWSFDGTPLAGLSAHQVARAGMVRTFQLTKALNRMTVLDNMLVAAPGQLGERFAAGPLPWLWRTEEAAVRERALQWLSHFGLADKRDEYAGTLSGGQRKLLEMARALMVSPRMLMLDEPMAGINPALTETLLEHIIDLRRHGMTVLFVEHDMDVVMEISDWVVCMAEGRIIAEGLPSLVAADPVVIDAYLGTHRAERSVARG